MTPIRRCGLGLGQVGDEVGQGFVVDHVGQTKDQVGQGQGQELDNY